MPHACKLIDCHQGFIPFSLLPPLRYSLWLPLNGLHFKFVHTLIFRCFYRIACTLCYYALTLGIRELAGSIFLNNFYSALAESVGYAACFSIAWWGRKWPTVAAFSGATIALLSAVLLQALMEGKQSITCQSHLAYNLPLFMLSSMYCTKTFYSYSALKGSAGAVTAMGMIGKMFIVMAWQIIIVWSSEIFPTTQRCILSSGIGMFGRVGSVLAPLCLDLVS